MYECSDIWTNAAFYLWWKTNHFHLERQKLRKMVTQRVVLSALLFVTIFYYSLENTSKFLWFYDAQFVGERGDSVNTTDTPYKMYGDNWYNFMIYKTCQTMCFLHYIPEKCTLMACCIITRSKKCIYWISQIRFDVRWALPVVLHNTPDLRECLLDLWIAITKLHNYWSPQKCYLPSQHITKEIIYFGYIPGITTSRGNSVHALWDSTI